LSIADVVRRSSAAAFSSAAFTAGSRRIVVTTTGALSIFALVTFFVIGPPAFDVLANTSYEKRRKIAHSLVKANAVFLGFGDRWRFVHYRLIGRSVNGGDKLCQMAA
jgi:hypothetical protein